MLEEILKLQRSGQLDLAEQQCNEWLAREPANAAALRISSMLHFERGDRERALRLAQAAVAAEPENAAHLAYLGGLEFSIGRADIAEPHLREALKLDPNTGSAHLFLGYLALERKDDAAAQEHFKSAERVNADDPQTLASLGNLALERNDPELASRYYVRAAELAPNEASIQLGLGRAFHARGVLAFAEQAFANALRLDANQHHARYRLGQLQLEQGQPAAAEPHFQALAGIEHYRIAGLVGLGDAARLGGRLEQAISHYRTALALDPQQPDAAIALAWCQLRLDQTEAAMDTYEALLALLPDEPRVLAARADLYTLTGQRGQALMAWQDILHRHPNDPNALARLPVLLEMHGELSAAEAMARQALQLNAHDVDGRFVLARAALRNADGMIALEHLLAIRSQDLLPAGRRQIDQHRGFALDRLDRFDEAVAAWLAAQQGLPANGTPWLKALPEDFFARIKAPPASLSDAPVLLLGAPGSGVVQLSYLLANDLNQLVLGDRFTPPARSDLFALGEFESYANLSDIEAERIREQYFAARAALNLDADRLIDWLPRWDARFLPAIQRALPGTRLIIVERDPRATLLNWLACGAAPGFALPDIDAAAQWLKLAQRHFAACAEVPGISVLRIDADAMQTDPDGTLRELAQFLDRPSAKIRGSAVPPPLAGLPSALPPLRWQAYRAVLGAAFARFDTN